MFLTTPLVSAPLHKLGLTEMFDETVGHLRRYQEDDLLEMIKEKGFKILKIKKNEGIIRNFLFVNPFAGKLVRFIKFFISDIITTIDEMSLKAFGASNIFVVAKKI